MLHRFASACLVGSIAVAIAAILMLLFPVVGLVRVPLLLVIWCCVPAGWGVWAMLAPASWLPNKLPLWGALLGCIAAISAIFVLQIPALVLGFKPPATWRFVLLLIFPVGYYFFWMLVRVAYINLGVRGEARAATKS